MIALRSMLFNIFAFVWTFFWVAGFLWVFLPFPRQAMREGVRAWAKTTLFGLKVLVGLDYEVRGRENLPDGAMILASKHQSAWDTAVFLILTGRPIYVMKKELLSIPLWGWYARKTRSIGVDRNAGAKALKDLVRDILDRLGRNLQVVIFPEGTRTAPGQRRPYHPGIAAADSRTDAPVIPVALNSGMFWSRRSFIKRPGTIVVEFLPAMPKGLNRKEFLAELENRIETASDRLAAEAPYALPEPEEGPASDPAKT